MLWNELKYFVLHKLQFGMHVSKKGAHQNSYTFFFKATIFFLLVVFLAKCSNQSVQHYLCHQYCVDHQIFKENGLAFLCQNRSLPLCFWWPVLILQNSFLIYSVVASWWANFDASPFFFANRAWCVVVSRVLHWERHGIEPCEIVSCTAPEVYASTCRIVFTWLRSQCFKIRWTRC